MAPGVPADKWGLERPILSTEEYRNSEFWRKKISYCFDFVDLNHDGTLTEEDAKLWVKLTLAEREKTSPEEEEKFKKATYDCFCKVFCAGADAKPITKKDFLLRLSADCQQPGFLDAMDEISDQWFGTLDEDGNGSLSWKEFYKAYKGLGRGTEEEAKKCFQALDIDGDGVISKKEWFLMDHHWLFGIDPTHPSRFMWGDYDAAEAKGIEVPEL